jgi:hypothetical protein
LAVEVRAQVTRKPAAGAGVAEDAALAIKVLGVGVAVDLGLVVADLAGTGRAAVDMASASGVGAVHPAVRDTNTAFMDGTEGGAALASLAGRAETASAGAGISDHPDAIARPGSCLGKGFQN